MIRIIVSGRVKVAEPIWTAAAPARKNSMASSTVLIPPTPMTGIDTAFAACQTQRKAIGLIAGPVNPAVVVPMRERRVWGSTAIPSTALIAVTATAPPASDARGDRGDRRDIGGQLREHGD